MTECTHSPLELALLVISCSIVLGVGLHQRRSQRREPSTKPLSWWVVAAARLVVVAVTWSALAWLHAEASGADDPASARVEAIKVGLTIGAGTGGVYALLLAVRRQWHHERATLNADHDAIDGSPSCTPEP